MINLRLVTAATLLASGAVIATPAAAVITSFAGSNLVSNSVQFTNGDAFVSTVVPAITTTVPKATSTITGSYTALQLGKTFNVAATTTSHAQVVTTNPDGTTTKSAYTTVTTPAYSYKVTSLTQATKTVPAYVQTTVPTTTTLKLTANVGTLSNVPTVTTGTYAGSTSVLFSFLNNSLAPFVTNKAAYFKLSATSTQAAASTVIPGFGTILTQPLLTGTFSFVSATDFSVRGTMIHVGDVFLSGSFSGSSIAALLNASTASIQASSAAAGQMVSFNDSIFLNFHNPLIPITETDATFGIDAIATHVSKQYDKSSLRSFNGALSTQFASDPAPTVLLVPEPQIWGMFVLGFGLVGIQTRRRARTSSVTA